MLGTTMYFGPMVMDNPIFKSGKGVDVEWARTLGDVSVIIMTVLMVIFALFMLLGSAGRVVVPNAADWLILKLPFYRDMVLAKNNHVTLYKLGLLVGSGVRIEEALRLTEDGAPRGALKTDLERARKAVKEGKKSWAHSMKTLHETDKAALSTSPDRKDISRTLLALATQYADLYIQRIETFGPLMGVVAAICQCFSLQLESTRFSRYRTNVRPNPLISILSTRSQVPDFRVRSAHSPNCGLGKRNSRHCDGDIRCDRSVYRSAGASDVQTGRRDDCAQRAKCSDRKRCADPACDHLYRPR
jgi:hypothetical protein